MSATRKREDENERLRNAGIEGAAAEIVQRYGSAAKEHLVAYSGVDRETGIQLKRSLKSIHKYKVNAGYKNQNLKQQAGFAAEVKETAAANAEKIISGKLERKVRTDDLGRVNDPHFDHVEVDVSGKVIAGSGTQMKFVGSSPQEALGKLTSKRFDKYFEQDITIEVPSDYYDKILSEADSRISDLQKQLDKQVAQGNADQANRLKEKIERLQKVKKNLKKSSQSTKDAMFARKHPNLSTAKDVAVVSHRAGAEAAQTAVLVGGSVSIVQNLVRMAKGEIGADAAAKNVAKDTAGAVAVGYGTGFAGAALKGAMQNAGSKIVRQLSKTNLPGVTVTVAVDSAKTMGRYFSGEITGLECFEELGAQGTGMLSSALFTLVGQAAIPIPVVGGMIGGMVGYAVASASYGMLLASMKDAELAREERIQIERVCEEHIQMIRTYRLELEQTIKECLRSNMQIFHDSFVCIKESFAIGDVDGFISGANAISEALGRDAQFKNMKEFDILMESNQNFKL